MAKNAGAIEQYAPIQLKLGVTRSAKAGTVLALNNLVVYLQTDADANDEAICTLPCAHAQVVSVTAADHSGASTVAVGDKLYLDSGVINKDSTDGVPLGYALEALAAGDTGNILVGFGL
jgi:hypothetical protein